MKLPPTWRLPHRLLSSLTSSSAAAAAASPPRSSAGERLLRRAAPPQRGNDRAELAAEAERAYTILRRYHPNTAKLEIVLRQSAISVNAELTGLVLKRCGDAAKLSYKFFQWASKQPGFSHTYSLYKTLIKQLSKMKQFGAVWAILEEMRKSNPAMISEELFVILIRRFAASMLLRSAVQVLDEMPEYGLAADGRVFRCLVEALCKKGRAKEAWALLEEKRGRFPAGLREYTAVVAGWCRQGRMVEAGQVLVEMRRAGVEPDVVVYNVLVGGYVESRRMGDAYDMLDVMRGAGCAPNTVSYTTIIRGLSARGDPERALRIAAEMERVGCPGDAVTHATIVRGLCRSGDLKKAHQMVKEMTTKRGWDPHAEAEAEAEAYLHLLKAYERRQDVGACVRVMEEMRLAGLTWDYRAYRAVIGAAAAAGDMEEAWRVWEEMEAAGPSPDVDVFVAMVNGSIREGRLADGAACFMELVGRGLYSGPHYGLLKVLVNSLIRGGEVGMAEDAWRCLVGNGCEVNACCWTIWVNALLEGGFLKEACLYCVEMLDAGVLPHVETFARIMRGLRKIYNRRIAVEITDRVRALTAERGVGFKMYKRLGEKSLLEKVKTKIRAADLRRMMMRKRGKKKKKTAGKRVPRRPFKAKVKL